MIEIHVFLANEKWPFQELYVGVWMYDYFYAILIAFK